MATNSIASMMNSKLRMTGLSSGLDIDGMITKLMSVEKMKVDKLKQSKTLLEWKTDSYRDVTSALKDLSSSYFDVLKSSTNIRSATAFSAYRTTYDGADTSNAISATAGSGAIQGIYNVTVKHLAATAKIQGTTPITDPVIGTAVTDAAVKTISKNNDNNRFMITFNGKTQEITLKEGLQTASELETELNDKIKAAFGGNKITAKLNADNTFTFSTVLTSDSFSINYSNNYGAATIFGRKIDPAKPLLLDPTNNKFKLSLDGATPVDFEVPAGSYTSDQLESTLNTLINNDSTFAGKIRVLNQNDTISLKVIGLPASATGALASPANVSNGVNVTDSNKDLYITLDGSTKPTKITLDVKDYTGKKGEMLAAIQSKLDGTFGANKVMVSMNGNSLRFESVSSTSTLAVKAKENLGKDMLGLNGINSSNRIDMNANLSDISKNFVGGNFTHGVRDADGNDIKFTINGQSFAFDSTKTSINTIIAKVNADTKANVTLRYDELRDVISVESKQTGVTAKIKIDDNSGNLMSLLNLNGKDVSGADSEITYNNGTGDQKVIRNSNDFTINGIAFSLKAETGTTAIKVNVSSDPSKTVDLIKGFVAKYNEVLDKINTKVSEKRYRDYQPLTDDQRSAMKDTDITNWETKAKSGLLNGDSMLQSIVTNMRTALYTPVDGVASSVTLSSIGITTGSYSDRGKLVIDEDKLRAAIIANPDQVSKLFTNTSQYSYTESLDNSGKRATRYQQSGLGQRLYDIIQDNIRTIRDSNGLKGVLLEKAGMIGDLSEFTNSLHSEIGGYDTAIDNMNQKLIDKENAYYAKFSAMETALSNMSAQSSWLSQQMGGR